MKKKIIGFAVFLALGKIAFSQQDAMYTHYMYNTLAINPAYAGTRDALTVTALHRSQWLDFPGAPVTQTITMHSPIVNKKIGVGLSAVNDRLGPTRITSMFGDFAYHLTLNEKSKLSLGLKAGMNLFTADLTQLQTTQTGDVSFSSDIQSKILPNFGFGTYYSRERFYAGVSLPKLVQNDFLSNTISGTTNLFSEQRHYFLIAGTMLDLNQDWKLHPSSFLKITSGAPVELDVTTQFVYNNKITFGAMYRTGDAAGILFGYNLLEQLQAGYSFDWSFLNSTHKYNSGSHEIVLRYDFIYKHEDKIKSPRYF